MIIKKIKQKQVIGYILFAVSLTYILTLLKLQDQLCTSTILYYMLIYFVITVIIFYVSRKMK